MVGLLSVMDRARLAVLPVSLFYVPAPNSNTHNSTAKTAHITTTAYLGKLENKLNKS